MNYVYSYLSKMNGMEQYNELMNASTLFEQVVQAFKEVVMESGYARFQDFSDALGKITGLEFAWEDFATGAINKLSFQGRILIDYRMGLPIYGRGFGGEPTKRLMKVEWA